jgi:hypothetical protein
MATSKFLLSPKSPEIVALIQKWRGRRSFKQIYEMALELDSGLPNYDSFLNFIKKFTAQANQTAKALSETMQRKALTDMQLLNGCLNQAAEIGDIVLAKTLEELKEKVESGEKIDWNTRQKVMKWFNDAGRMTIQQQFLKIRDKEADTNLAALSLLANAARYQKLKPEEIGGEIIAGEFSGKEENYAIKTERASLPALAP